MPEMDIVCYESFYSSVKHTSAFKCLLKADIETAIIAKCCERKYVLNIETTLTVTHSEGKLLRFVRNFVCRTLNLTILLCLCSLLKRYSDFASELIGISRNIYRKREAITILLLERYCILKDRHFSTRPGGLLHYSLLNQLNLV